MCHAFSRTITCVPLVITLTFLYGCGRPEGQFAVSGTVTFDGQPVANGTIAFSPMDPGKGKTVGTDVVDGHYEFSAYEGPKAGKYKVVILADGPSGRKMKSLDTGEMVDILAQYIPAAYNERTTLTVEVTGDRDDLDFVLKKQ